MATAVLTKAQLLPSQKARKLWNKYCSWVYMTALAAIVLIVWQCGGLHVILGQAQGSFPYPFEKIITTTNALTGSVRETTDAGVFNYFFANLFTSEGQYGSVLYNTGVTLSAMIPGFLLGGLLGYLFATVATVFSRWGGGSLTILTVLVSVPVVALAPVLVNLCGTNAYLCKLLVVTICCMAGMAVNAYKGLNSIKPFSEDLMKMCDAPRRVTFFKLRVPNSLPNVFTACKINVATATSAVFISEFYARTTITGLGKVFKQLFDNQARTQAWAYIVAAVVVGLLLYMIVVILEKRAIGWHSSMRVK